MGIMAAGFIKGASDAFTQRMTEVIEKKANLKEKIGQETAVGDLVEKSLLKIGQKNAQNVIKIANEWVKSNGLDQTGKLSDPKSPYTFIKELDGNSTAIENAMIGVMLEANKDPNISITNPADWDRVLSPNRIGLYEPALMTNEIKDNQGQTSTQIQYYDPRTLDTPMTYGEPEKQSWIQRTLREPTQAGILEEEARERGVTVADIERKRAVGALGGDTKSLVESGVLVPPTLGESLAGIVQVPLASLKYMSATVPAFEDDVIEKSVEYYFSLDTPNLHNLFYKNNKPGGGYENLTDAGKTATAQMALHISSDKFTDNIVAQQNMNRVLNELELPLLPGTLGDEGVDSSQLVAFLYRQGVLDQNSTVDDAVAVLKRQGSTGDKIRSDAVALLNMIKQYHESLKE